MVSTSGLAHSECQTASTLYWSTRRPTPASRSCPAYPSTITHRQPICVELTCTGATDRVALTVAERSPPSLVQKSCLLKVDRVLQRQMPKAGSSQSHRWSRSGFQLHIPDTRSEPGRCRRWNHHTGQRSALWRSARYCGKRRC
jgi:hypothetical protein